MLDALVAHAGLGDVLDSVISVDAARAFKPHPGCYALVKSVLQVARQDVVFVSSNGFDISGAKRFGFTTVWLNRAPPEECLSHRSTPLSSTASCVLSRNSWTRSPTTRARRLSSSPICGTRGRGS